MTATPSGPQVSGGTLPMYGQSLIAERFAQAFDGHFIYVINTGWYYWTGTHWELDDESSRARSALNRMLKAMWSASFGDTVTQASIKACMSNAGQLGALSLAEVFPQFATRFEDLDADPYLLNTANGTLDLRTGVLRPHDQADRITRRTEASFGSDEGESTWSAFLERILPDEEVRAYLQRIAGVGLLGTVTEHIFPIAIGTGANGKSTFVKALLHALGTYGYVADPELFIFTKVTNANAPSPSIIELRGRRFVVCSETEDGAQLAATRMKNLTGGDPITARALYRNPVTFTPSHTAFVITNHLPKVKGDSPAVWRRIRVLPFDVVIPADEIDPHLDDKLRLCADAVLAWAYQGYLDYQQHGMSEPLGVDAATMGYRQQGNRVAVFCNELTVASPGSKIPAPDLWAAWVSWVEANQEDPISQREFYRMAKNILANKRDSTGNVFTDVALVPAIDEDAMFTT